MPVLFRGILFFNDSLVDRRLSSLLNLTSILGAFKYQESIYMFYQGRRDGTSSVAFEVLIMNCNKDLINLFIFNYLASNINLFIFHCLTLTINLFIFSCLTSNFVFRKSYIFQAEENDCLWACVRIFGF